MGRAQLLETLEDSARKGHNTIHIVRQDLLTWLPEVARFPNVTHLYLSGGLTALPPEIGLLTGLTDLLLYGNHLTALPPEICRLARLERLSLQGNRLTALPPEIGRLASLTDLRLDGNQLTALPAEIGRLARLTRLDLTGNRLTALPAEIGGLTGLAELNLTDNQLAALPPEIGQMAGLAQLQLRGNRLTELPAEIGRLASLTHLDLRGNRLGTLPPQVGGLTRLRQLNLSGNHLERLPAEIGRLRSLTALDLWGNRLEGLPPHLCQLSSLESLVLNGNPLASPLRDVLSQGCAATLCYLQGQLPPCDLPEAPPTSAPGTDLERLEAQLDPRNLASLQRLHQARREAGWTWRGRTPEAWIEQLGEHGKDRKHTLGVDVYEAIRDLGVSAVPVLIDALGHVCWRVRRGAAWLLAELGPAAVCARYALRRALTDTRARVRRAAAEALRRIGPGAREAAPALVARLTTDLDPEVRSLAAQALGEVAAPEPSVIEPLLAALDGPLAPLRLAAVAALARLGGGLDPVAKRLEEQLILDDDARPLVAAALVRLAPGRLARVALEYPECLLKPHTYQGYPVLRRLAMHGAEAAPLLRAFVALLSTPARTEALFALERMGSAARDAIPAIAQTLDRPARAALRSIYFASWLEAESRARADPARWRQRLLQRFQDRWQRQPLGKEGRQTIEAVVRQGSRPEILAARLRAGDVARERLELAAALGDRPSMTVLGWPCPPGDEEGLDENAYNAWAAAMQAQPPEARARVGHAAARDVSPLVQEWYLGANDAISIHALEDWLCSPTPRSLDRLAAAQLELGWPTQGWEGASGSAGRAIGYACTPEHDGSNPSATLREALSAWRAWPSRLPLYARWHGTGRPFGLEVLPLGDAIRHVREVVRSWVVPWALDEGDPVREPLQQLFETYPGARNSAW